MAAFFKDSGLGGVGLPFLLIMGLVLTVLPSVVRTEVYYPPFFNVALMKPVSVEPDGSTCGQTGAATFCRSMTDSQSAFTCHEATCNMACPHSFQLGYFESLFSRVRNPNWGSCVVRNSTMLSPMSSSSQSYSVHFHGTSEIPGDPCYLDLDPTWVVSQLILMPRWDVTLSMWIYPEMNNTETGLV